MTRDQVRVSLAARGFACLPPVLAEAPPRAWLPRPVALRLVAEACGVTIAQLTGTGQRRVEFRARALFFLLARQLGRPFSDTQLGRELGGRDHSTIGNLARRAEAMRAADPAFAAAFGALVDRAIPHLIGPTETAHACH